MNCDNVIGQDYETEHDLACGTVATYVINGQPRCIQCAHDWLDEVCVDEREHTVIFLRANQPAATETGRTPGRRAYEAFARQSGVRFVFPWDEMHPEKRACWEAAARWADPAPQGAPCLHTLNELGHCARCGARPNDRPQGAPHECTCGADREHARGARGVPHARSCPYPVWPQGAPDPTEEEVAVLEKWADSFYGKEWREPEGAPDPRLADALAHPPGPRHARLVEAEGAPHSYAIGAGGGDDGCSACGAGQHDPCVPGCEAALQKGDTVIAFGEEGTFVQMSAGREHVKVRHPDGERWYWAENVRPVTREVVK